MGLKSLINIKGGIASYFEALEDECSKKEKTNCIISPGCKYDKYVKTCKPKHCNDRSKIDCTITRGCTWNNEENKCTHPTNCKTHTNKLTCNINYGCGWDKTAKKCRNQFI